MWQSFCIIKIMKHVCQPVDIRAVKLYNVKKEGGAENESTGSIRCTCEHSRIEHHFGKKRLITIFCAVQGIIQTMESIRRK